MRLSLAIAAFSFFSLLAWPCVALAGGKTVPIPLANGFDYPVGPPDAKNYYKSRGFRPNGHLGDDWNGMGGGNTDLGDPIYCVGNGIVVLARDVRLGWGNCVIVRHAFKKDGKTLMVDTLYAHLQRVDVREGQVLKKGQRVGTMGSNRGMYMAHLHFEVRKNLNLGMDRTKYARDLSNYWDPTLFIASHRKLPGSGFANVPVDTFSKDRTFNPPVDEAKLKGGKKRDGSSKASNVKKSRGSSSKIILKLNNYKDILEDL